MLGAGEFQEFDQVAAIKALMNPCTDSGLLPLTLVGRLHHVAVAPAHSQHPIGQHGQACSVDTTRHAATPAVRPHACMAADNQSQGAGVKIDTFNFTKYGLIDAQLVNISDDAVEDEKLGLVFKLRLTLDKDSIVIGKKRVKLSPGMAVTAEIKTGKRRLIEFFLSPLLRYKQESVRER
jgi:hypothetical protein